MKVAVLGSGFGLYGYLPALVSLGQTVVLPQRYRQTVEARNELAGFAADVEWQADDEAVLDHARALVIARRPEDQQALLPKVLARPQIDRLILEKPLARDPEHATRLHDALAASAKAFRVSYTFPLTVWGQRLKARSTVRDDIDIIWRFRAHHYATNAQSWKRRHAHGGGALRFYGIQMIGLLAQLGYDRVLSSETTSSAPDEIEAWAAVISGAAGASCRVTIDSNAARSEFSIRTASQDTSVSLDDPFGEQVGPQDRRVPLLAALCAEALQGDPKVCDWYERAIVLWRQVEQATVHRNA